MAIDTKVVLLLSGGIDSTTTLYYAVAKGYKLFCLTFDYKQRNKREISSARRLARLERLPWRLLKIELPWKGSSLLDKEIELPKGRLNRHDIPSTYVPARNLIFLSYAVSYAEAIGAKYVFIGANQIDYSGYPDCRLSFIKAFEEAAGRGTKRGARGRRIRIITPLINKSKKEIIELAVRLKVPFRFTWSCYRGEDDPCEICDACVLRAKGFREAGFYDPLMRKRR